MGRYHVWFISENALFKTGIYGTGLFVCGLKMTLKKLTPWMKSFPRTHGVNLNGMNISECTSNWTSAVELRCTSDAIPIQLVEMALWSNKNRAGAVYSEGCNVLVVNSTFHNNTARTTGGGMSVVRMSQSNARNLSKYRFQWKQTS